MKQQQPSINLIMKGYDTYAVLKGGKNVIKFSDNSDIATDKNPTQNKQSESQKNASGSIADGIDDGFKYGLIIGIPILLIILILPFYAKYRQKNPSK